MLSALSFVLALPAVLIGVISFRASAFALAGLFAWDVVSTTWPHITLGGIANSLVDSLLLMCAVMAALLAVINPYPSLIGFLRLVVFR